jgi:chromosomal replication initiation ATPase DnaA
MAELTEHTFFPFPAHPLCAAPEPDELIDTLKRVLRRATTDGGTPQLARFARRTLAQLRRIQDAEALGAISAFVACEFHLRPAVLKSKARGQHTAFCRQLAMHLCRRITGKPFATIGTHFNRNHASVIYACQLIERRMTRDAAFGLFIEQLERQITGAAASTATANA